MTGNKKLMIWCFAGLLVLLLSQACNFSAPPASPTPAHPGLPNPSPTPPPAIPAGTSAPTAAVTPPTQAPSPTQASGSDTRRVQIFLIALEDNGTTGEPVGCGDSLVPVQQDVPASADPAQAALERLFSLKDQFYGESGLYNSLYQSDLRVDSFSVDGSGHATLNLAGEFLLGGACDDPRFIAQIKETVLQFPEIQTVSIFWDGKPLEELLSGQG